LGIFTARHIAKKFLRYLISTCKSSMKFCADQAKNGVDIKLLRLAHFRDIPSLTGVRIGSQLVYLAPPNE